MKNNKLAEMVEQTLNSMDGAERATPAPFLLTRINAKMNREQPSAWERFGIFLSRPIIALSTIAFLIFFNLIVYTYSNSSSNINGSQNLQVSTDEYSMNNSSSLFDLENIQP